MTYLQTVGQNRKMTEDEKYINKLRGLIIEEDDKVLFEEAAGCFLSNHLRASYIISWISIIESLKRKINQFTNLGDKRAIEANKKIEEFEEKKSSTDKLIFEEAKNCGIIDNSDFSKISFLWEQRCIFAHPYNKQPESDEVKYIIGQTVNITLGKELLYNKTFLTELTENITNKPFFLPPEIDQVRIFAKRAISRTPENLHPFFFKTLLFKVSEIALNDEKFSELRKLRYYLVELFINTETPFDNSNWALENRVTNYPYECFVGFVHQETWSKLPDRIKEMLISYFENETDNQKLIALKSISSYLIENDALEERYVNRLHKKLDVIPFDSAIYFYGNVKSKFDRIWRDLSSYSFDIQNPVIDFLKTDKASELIKGIDQEKQFNLGRIIKASASNNHWKSQNFIAGIVQGLYKMPDYLKLGISYGSFVSMQEKLSIDNKEMEQSINLLNSAQEDFQNGTYDSIESFINKNEPDDFEVMLFNEAQFIDLTANILDNIVDWNNNNKARFIKLIDIIKNYFAQQQI